MRFNEKNKHLILGVTGASGSYAAEVLLKRSSWPVDLILSDWGIRVMEYENVSVSSLVNKASRQFQNDDLFALPSSGSVPTAGMVVLPCSVKTLGEIANGTGGNLISRAAHCHLKEKRSLIICLRETPLTNIDINNMKIVDSAGGTIMPICPPFFMFSKSDPNNISMNDLLNSFVDRVLSLLGQDTCETWENIV